MSDIKIDPEPGPPTISPTQELVEMHQQYVIPTYAPELYLTRGKGSYVWDADGKKYLDFLSGIAVNSLGHKHPSLLKAIKRQCGKIIHSSNLYYNENQPKLAKKLSEHGPGGACFFSNSGAEANEALIKLARYWGGGVRHEVITVRNSFHGRTLTTLTATGQDKVQKGFHPLPEGFKYAELNDIESVIAKMGPKTAAVLVEPIQGEGGVVPAQRDFIQQLREECSKRDILLMFDEIQTGIGRTGKWFGYQHFDVEPDAISLAKGLGGGLPIGAIVTNEKFAKVLQPGTHGSTFGGNPLSCAAALAVIETIEKKNLIAQSEKLGKLLKTKLEKLKNKYSFIEEITGEGLMLGIRCDQPCKDLERILCRKGLITLATAEKVIRLLPPLTVSASQIRSAAKIIDRGCAEWQIYNQEK